MQYVNLIASTSATEDILNWHVSSVSLVDDSPFERVRLPVLFVVLLSLLVSVSFL